MPDLEPLEILKLVNCPETFTPDMRCIMGEAPSVQGYFVLAGMNSAGLSFGGGAGRWSLLLCYQMLPVTMGLRGVERQKHSPDFFPLSYSCQA
ncbi:pyruvate dehydrogenase phosphatase regulatory subunit, mitochondrial-like isoform X1 [Manis pentadactyla]|uniref:pyruvate dehydrogenase phosphatase regulatory subunit, mitochondrial-like isoform X1 n=1 Tax=Manis pentadactyla TaxID=143292 RepID=UPI00255CA947|nr:pyruvate dehydrogenase phosphatase regulatory subunit, mitochondrial-like isoform X1 [Manis pentadactyla]